MKGVVIEELESSTDEDFGTPTSRGSSEDNHAFHSPGGSEKDLKGDYEYHTPQIECKK
jgi:hypothetical protein